MYNIHLKWIYNKTSVVFIANTINDNCVQISALLKTTKSLNVVELLFCISVDV